MNKEREELANELFELFEVFSNVKTESVYDNHTRWLAVADYVIKDRKRICEPLIKFKEECESRYNGLGALRGKKSIEAIDETLKRAGLGE